VLHAKLRNKTCQGLDRQGQGQGLTSLLYAAAVSVINLAADSVSGSKSVEGGFSADAVNRRHIMSNASRRCLLMAAAVSPSVYCYWLLALFGCLQLDWQLITSLLHPLDHSSTIASAKLQAISTISEHYQPPLSTQPEHPFVGIGAMGR